MYWSAAVVALVPFGVTTVTSTVPVPAGEVAVIDDALTGQAAPGAEPKYDARWRR